MSKTRPLTLAVMLVLGSTNMALPRVALADNARAAAPSGEVADRAARLKKQGDEAIVNIKFADALRFYEESFRLVANPALHYNRGRAFEALKRTVEAIEAYEMFMRDAPPELRAKAQGLPEHVEELRGKTAKLAVDVDVAGARVRLRQAVLGTTPLAPTRVNAGSASLEVESEGYVTHRAQIDLSPGGAVALKVHLVPKVDPAASATNASSPTPSTSERPTNVLERWWFWTGVGVVVAGGATVAIIALSSQSDPAPREGTLGTVSAPLLRF